MDSSVYKGVHCFCSFPLRGRGVAKRSQAQGELVSFFSVWWFRAHLRTVVKVSGFRSLSKLLIDLFLAPVENS